MDAEQSQCAVHPVAATGICGRCGRFGCAQCLNETAWCVQCQARPEARLLPSDRAKTALMLSLFGLHGVVVLLPVALWLARKELAAIERGKSVPAGIPYARGSIAIAGAGSVLWLAALLWWISR